MGSLGNWEVEIARVGITPPMVQYVLLAAGGAPTMKDAIAKLRALKRAEEEHVEGFMNPLLTPLAEVRVKVRFTPLLIPFVLHAYSVELDALYLTERGLWWFEQTDFTTPMVDREPPSLNYVVQVYPLVFIRGRKMSTIRSGSVPVLREQYTGAEWEGYPHTPPPKLKERTITLNAATWRTGHLGLDPLSEGRMHYIIREIESYIKAGKHQTIVEG